MSLHELKPCPFCGGNADKHIDDYGEGKFCVTVRCSKCGAKVFRKGAIETATEQAVNAWNNRADERKSAFDNAGWEQLLLLFSLLFVEPPRREITINAQINGKSVNITYDPHDPESVKAAEAWRKALFAGGTQFKAVEPVAVKAGDVVAFAEPRNETNGDKIRKANISEVSELLAAVKFGWWDNSYEIKSGVSVPHPEIFNKLNAYAGRMPRGDITCLDLIQAMTDNDLSEWLCLFRDREAEAWEHLMGVPRDYSKPPIPESEREKFFFWLKKRSGTDCVSEPSESALDAVF